jgi:hypothetical protein
MECRFHAAGLFAHDVETPAMDEEEQSRGRVWSLLLRAISRSERLR